MVYLGASVHTAEEMLAHLVITHPDNVLAHGVSSTAASCVSPVHRWQGRLATTMCTVVCSVVGFMRSQKLQQVSFKPFNAETFRSTLQRAFHCDISNAETPCEPTQMPQSGGGRAAHARGQRRARGTVLASEPRSDSNDRQGCHSLAAVGRRAAGRSALLIEGLEQDLGVVGARVLGCEQAACITENTRIKVQYGGLWLYCV